MAQIKVKLKDGKTWARDSLEFKPKDVAFLRANAKPGKQTVKLEDGNSYIWEPSAAQHKTLSTLRNASKPVLAAKPAPKPETKFDATLKGIAARIPGTVVKAFGGEAQQQGQEKRAAEERAAERWTIDQPPAATPRGLTAPAEEFMAAFAGPNPNPTAALGRAGLGTWEALDKARLGMTGLAGKAIPPLADYAERQKVANKADFDVRQEALGGRDFYSGLGAEAPILAALGPAEKAVTTAIPALRAAAFGGNTLGGAGKYLAGETAKGAARLGIPGFVYEGVTSGFDPEETVGGGLNWALMGGAMNVPGAAASVLRSPMAKDAAAVITRPVKGERGSVGGEPPKYIPAEQRPGYEDMGAEDVFKPQKPPPEPPAITETGDINPEPFRRQAETIEKQKRTLWQRFTAGATATRTRHMQGDFAYNVLGPEAESLKAEQRWLSGKSERAQNYTTNGINFVDRKTGERVTLPGNVRDAARRVMDVNVALPDGSTMTGRKLADNIQHFMH